MNKLIITLLSALAFVVLIVGAIIIGTLIGGAIGLLAQCAIAFAGGIAVGGWAASEWFD